MKNYQQDGRGLYATTPDQIKDYILTYFAKDSILLGEVDNTSDANKPVSKATQLALNTKLDKSDLYVRSLNGQIGDLTLDKTFVGLGNVNNTSDVNKPISSATKAALDTKADIISLTALSTSTNNALASTVKTSALGASLGVATLTANKTLVESQIPILPKAKVPTAQAADRFTTPVELRVTDDVLGSVVIDGSTKTITLNATLKDSGVIPGRYGSAVSIPSVTVNSKGIVTSVEYIDVPPASTTQPGVISLSDTIGSTSRTQAATINSVTTVYNLAKSVSDVAIPLTEKGTPHGVATLDETGKLKPEQLPASGTIIAERLGTSRNISMTGDGTWTVSFNGSGDVSGQLLLSTVLTNPGNFGSATTTAAFSVDARGRITKIENKTITPVFSSISSKPTTISGYGITDAYTKEQTDAACKNAVTTAAPPGAVMYFSARTPPTGWLVCNGQAVSRVTYADLFKVIGTLYGPGDGKTTFNLPQAQGEFIRGWDSDRNVDPERVFGSAQEDEFKSHIHMIKEGSINPHRVSGQEMLTSGDDFTQIASYTSTSGASGGTETRPRNIALLTIIKT